LHPSFISQEQTVMNDTARTRALAQTIAKIHWSIAYVGLDSMLEPGDLQSPTQAAEMSAALALVDEALAELRAAYRLVPAAATASTRRVQIADEIEDQ
jgi:hypothetical protein